MRTPRSRDLSHLRAYLQEQRHPLASRALPAGLLGPAILIGTIFLAVWSVEFIPGWLAFLAFPFCLGIGMSVLFSVSSALQKPRNEEEARRVRNFEIAQSMSHALQRKQLHPLARRLLEGCAHHRYRIVQAVLTPGWESTYWRGVRNQAVEAADEGMEQALEICSRFAGPQFSRSGAWKAFATDVAEGQLGGALKRLQKMLEADHPGDTIDRRDLPPELWPVYEIALKLQRLAPEMDKAAQDVSSVHHGEASRLDQVLSDLSAMRQAEQELESERLHQY